MGFSFDDFINSSVPTGGVDREMFSGEIANLTPISVNQAQEIFPDVKLTESNSILYFPLKMCHSLPKVNKRGRCFTAKTLANSFASALDSVIDREHMLLSNGDVMQGIGSDQIIGHIKAAVFDPEGISGSDIASASVMPEKPVPLYALAALYLRAEGVAGMIKDHLSGQETWQTSMECGHNWKNAHLMYRGEFIPIAEAPGQMLEGIKPSAVAAYNGHDVAAVLGGVDGRVDFWGLGFTTNPADDEGDLLGVVGGLSRDLASREIFHVPLRSIRLPEKEKTLEVASNAVDKKITELANIAVIGETEEAGTDSHTHLILSDLTILPSGDHDHYLDSKNIGRGTKPRLTGRTGAHYAEFRDQSDLHHSVPHLHLIDVPLTGKFASPLLSTGKDDEGASTEISNIGDDDMLKEILEKLDALSKSAASAPKGEGEFKAFAEGFQATVAEIKEIASANSLDEAIETEIANRVKEGKIVVKEVADAAVAEAVSATEKKKDEEHEAENKSAEIRTRRLDDIRNAGIALDFELEGVEAEAGKPLTIQGYLDQLATDETGDRDFAINFSSWKKILESSQVGKEKQEEEEKLAAAAASAKDGDKKKANSIIAAVGGATSEEEEIASAPEDLEGKPSHMRGRHAFSK